jgi:hypothetical protein
MSDAPGPNEPPSAETVPGPLPSKTAREPLDAEGMERPAFILDFPEDPELDVLVSAFESGNYKKVRAEADALAGKTSNPKVREAALELRRRIDPDPLVKYLLALSFTLLLFLTVWAYRK